MNFIRKVIFIKIVLILFIANLNSAPVLLIQITDDYRFGRHEIPKLILSNIRSQFTEVDINDYVFYEDYKWLRIERDWPLKTLDLYMLDITKSNDPNKDLLNLDLHIYKYQLKSGRLLSDKEAILFMKNNARITYTVIKYSFKKKVIEGFKALERMEKREELRRVEELNIGLKSNKDIVKFNDNLSDCKSDMELARHLLLSIDRFHKELENVLKKKNIKLLKDVIGRTKFTFEELKKQKPILEKNMKQFIMMESLMKLNKEHLFSSMKVLLDIEKETEYSISIIISSEDKWQTTIEEGKERLLELLDDTRRRPKVKEDNTLLDFQSNFLTLESSPPPCSGIKTKLSTCHLEDKLKTIYGKLE